MKILSGVNRVLITCHVRPDGDSCGSMAAMGRHLKGQGIEVRYLLLSDVPDYYLFLFDEKPVVLGKDVTAEQLIGTEFFQPDLIVIVDTNNRTQLPGFVEYLNSSQAKVLVIDHHVTGENLGDENIVDSSAAAAGLIVYELFVQNGWELKPEIAQALFTAIASDTGWLRFGNTDGRALGACAELAKAGADPAKIYHQIYENFSAEKFELLKRMLGKMELLLGGRYAQMHLTQADFDATGTTSKDTENFIDQANMISSVEVSAFFVEMPEGKVKCSLRSRTGVDVGGIAQQLGGGGHRVAAGVRLAGPIERAKEEIYSYISRTIGETRRN